MAEIVKTIADIVLQINEAVDTVRQNKEACRRIASCAKTYSGLVECLVQGTDINKNKFLRDTLEEAKSTFKEALKLVEKCQQRHLCCRFFWANDIASELKNMLEDLKLKINQANSCGIVYNATTYYAAIMAPAPPRSPQPPPAPPLPPGEDDIEVSPEGFTRFSLAVLKQATNNFSNETKVGEGGFSSVYKGVLHDGRAVAIKKFEYDNAFADYSEEMWRNEFITGIKLQHKNVVSFLGYCAYIRVVFVEHQGRIVDAHWPQHFLVLGHVPNGSLDEVVQGTRHIDWPSCFKIIQEIAEGVHYIHEQRVIHLHLKPSNILFNSDMTPVIIHFGFSKVLEHGEDKVLLEKIFGTLGYIAPEQLYDHVASLQSDVYSFGMTLLRTLINWDNDAIEKHYISDSESDPWYTGEQWERILEEVGGLNRLVNRAIHVDDSQLTEINRCVEVGRLCAELDPADRPCMAEVVDMLTGKKMLPTPKKDKNRATKKVERASSKKLGRADPRT